MRALWLISVESSIRIKNVVGYVSIAELWFPYDHRIAKDRRQSQTIAEDRTWFYLLRSSAIMIAGSQTIAEDLRRVFPYDRRRSQNFL